MSIVQMKRAWYRTLCAVGKHRWAYDPDNDCRACVRSWCKAKQALIRDPYSRAHIWVKVVRP